MDVSLGFPTARYLKTLHHLASDERKKPCITYRLDIALNYNRYTHKTNKYKLKFILNKKEKM